MVDFFTAHSDGVFPRSLTETWRSSLKQQSTQVGQTTSKFSLLEFLQNENKSDFEEYPDGVGSPGEDPVNVDVRVDDDLRLDESATSTENIQTDQLTSDFWSTSLEMDFDGYDARVDPFSRIFDDWALVAP